ncbi:MAG: N-acetylmuramoyl-L-alanine amidase-like domain-containing protein [Cyanobacteria bacterium J06641_5]
METRFGMGVGKQMKGWDIAIAFGVWATGTAAIASEPVAPEQLTSQPTVAATVEARVPLEDRRQDRARFWGLAAWAAAGELHERPLGDTVQTLAEQLLGADYQGGLLDRFDDERLVISLYDFDCVLFVETALALGQGAIARDVSYDNFVQRVETLRYRDGQLTDYCSRLHYFTDWIADNAARGNIRPLTLELGGVAQDKPLTFMSGHRHLYKHLANSDRNFACIQAMEARIAEGLTVDYVPTEKISGLYDRLQAGDIIAVATDISGLDVTHSGLVYRHEDGRIGFIHASPAGKTVIAQDLQTYVERIDRAIGIMVARPL